MWLTYCTLKSQSNLLPHLQSINTAAKTGHVAHLLCLEVPIESVATLAVNQLSSKKGNVAHLLCPEVPIESVATAVAKEAQKACPRGRRDMPTGCDVCQE